MCVFLFVFFCVERELDREREREWESVCVKKFNPLDFARRLKKYWHYTDEVTPHARRDNQIRKILRSTPIKIDSKPKPGIPPGLSGSGLGSGSGSGSGVLSRTDNSPIDMDSS